MIRTFPYLIVAGLTLSACVTGGYQTVGQDPPGDALGQLTADCGEQELAPEFDTIRSRIPMGQTGATPSLYMLASTDIPTPEARIEIARLSEIRDNCTLRGIALMEVPPGGLPQPLWQLWPQVIAILQQDSENQHALMMALASGEMSYGPFVEASWRMQVRRNAATQPFLQEAGVLDNVAVVHVPAAGGPSWEDWANILEAVPWGPTTARGGVRPLHGKHH